MIINTKKVCDTINRLTKEIDVLKEQMFSSMPSWSNRKITKTYADIDKKRDKIEELNLLLNKKGQQ